MIENSMQNMLLKKREEKGENDHARRIGELSLLDIRDGSASTGTRACKAFLLLYS